MAVQATLAQNQKRNLLIEMEKKNTQTAMNQGKHLSPYPLFCSHRHPHPHLLPFFFSSGSHPLPFLSYSFFAKGLLFWFFLLISMFAILNEWVLQATSRVSSVFGVQTPCCFIFHFSTSIRMFLWVLWFPCGLCFSSYDVKSIYMEKGFWRSIIHWLMVY